jgi:hypothetical protein
LGEQRDLASRHSGELTLPPVVTLGRHRLDLHVADAGIEALAARFAAEHVLALPQFLGADLLSLFDARLPAARFTARVEDGVEIEHALDDPALIGLLLMIINDPALFGVVRRLAGCAPIGCFTGRVQRRTASDGRRHYYPWHTDATEGRLVGLTVNLGHEPFAGGTLQMRRTGSGAIVAEATHQRRGDAFLFRIAEDFEHHVTPLTSGSRLVLAGWFRDAENFWIPISPPAASYG